MTKIHEVLILETRYWENESQFWAMEDLTSGCNPPNEDFDATHCRGCQSYHLSVLATMECRRACTKYHVEIPYA